MDEEEKEQDPTQFSISTAPPGEDPPPADDPEALAFLQSRGWPSDSDN